jgi:digeranylgeranylglycerophospholipid reductase
VLDCSGCPSQSRREYDLPYGHLALGIQYRIKADVASLLGRLRIYFREGEVGYAWVFPKSPVEANVGIGWAKDAPRGKWGRLDDFVSREIGDYEVLKRMSGHIPMGMPPKLLLGNVLLCGDAAGLANPYIAGGNHNALMSGAIAGRCLLEGAPSLYEERLLEKVRSELNVARFARDLLENSYRYHETVVAHLERRFPVDRVFSEESYRSLAPLIRAWKLRCSALEGLTRLGRSIRPSSHT